MKQFLAVTLSVFALPCAVQAQDYNQVDTYMKRGYDLFVNNHDSQALAYFEKAYRLAPNDVNVRLNVGMAKYSVANQGNQPRMLIEACTLLRGVAAEGVAVAREIITVNWPECGKYGNTFYVGSDNKVRYRTGQPRGNAGLSQGSFIF